MGKIILDDPSEFRPEPIHSDLQLKFTPEAKPTEQFRDYTAANQYFDRVKKTYLDIHTHQTVQFVERKIAEWGRFDRCKMTIMEALDLLNAMVDESDPDINLPNIAHAFQTAEQIRTVWPEHDWFHLTGLIHDLGKVMAVWGEPQWAVTGDTFVVGCEFVNSIVFRSDTFNHNPDGCNPKYNTKYGMYRPNCGLEQIKLSWGHDEYLYRVLVHNKSTLPKEGLSMIRFHSFYPWHTGEDYMHLCNAEDMEMLKWVREFNKFDLYTKCERFPDIEALKPYYQALIDKYMPGKLEF
ncbi:inositol oxygenase-like [Paramacrobiotus metropolitanus]|uniref:inositol oxygenase-like n=1 Tax=Paramacrobiotus metropolitanus TaxID=2943436 RepID=UPI002445976F|nr:inositol oxygenase-like [Paramacrobiotus metropolitanus]